MIFFGELLKDIHQLPPPHWGKAHGLIFKELLCEKKKNVLPHPSKCSLEPKPWLGKCSLAFMAAPTQPLDWVPLLSAQKYNYE